MGNRKVKKENKKINKKPIIKEQKILGFIVPIYNTPKKWIKKCLDSLIIANTKTSSRIEALIIDNGSTDKTIWKWLNENYSTSFLKLHRIDKNNGKKGSTWYGLNNIKADYIQILNSDDWINTKSINRVINILEKSKGDFYFLNYEYYNNKTKNTKLKVTHRVGLKIDYKKFDSVPRMIWHSDINTIFKKDFMLENGFKFPEAIKFYEDVYINMWILSKTQNVYFINESIYFYRVGLEGANLSSTTKFIQNLPYFKNMVEELVHLDYSNDFSASHMQYHFGLQVIALLFWFADDEDVKLKDEYKQFLNEIYIINPTLYKKIKSWSLKDFNLERMVFWGGNNFLLDPARRIVKLIRK